MYVVKIKGMWGLKYYIIKDEFEGFIFGCNVYFTWSYLCSGLYE